MTGAVSEELWHQFGSRLRGFISKKVPNRADVDDLLQEAFLRLIQKGPAESGNLKAWIFTVIRNLIHDYYRGRDLDALPPEDLSDGERFEVTESEQVVAAWLTEMVDDLPERYREAVRLADLESASMKEVADRLSLSVSGAKSRVQRGRKMLAHALLDCCSFHFDQKGRVAGWQRNDPCSCKNPC